MSTAPQSAHLDAQIAQQQVPPGHVLAWWLGGSGFVFKAPSGTQIYIDPYLSNAVEGIFGEANRRGFPAPIEPENVRADAVVSTHWHEDHLDPGAIPVIARSSPATRFIMPPTATARALSWGVPRDRVAALTVGQSLAIGDVTVTAV